MKTRAREKVRQVKVCATRRDDLPCILRHHMVEGVNQLPQSWPLTSTWTPWHVHEEHTHTHKDIHVEISNRIMIYWFLTSLIHSQHSWDTGVWWSIRNFPNPRHFHTTFPIFPKSQYHLTMTFLTLFFKLTCNFWLKQFCFFKMLCNFHAWKNQGSLPELIFQNSY